MSDKTKSVVVTWDKSTRNKEVYKEDEGDFVGSIYLRKFDLPNPPPKGIRITFEYLD